MVDMQIVSKPIAQEIAALNEGAIKAILRIASCRKNAKEILEICERVAEGDSTIDTRELGQPKPLKIQGWSFINDHQICCGRYGMSVAEAAETKEMCHTNPAEALRTIQNVVARYLAGIGSTRPFIVTLDESISRVGGKRQPSGNDGGRARLAALARGYSPFVGAYSFSVQDSGKQGPEAFFVDLGDNLAVAGQSKTVALSAARLVRILGRHHAELQQFTRYFVPGYGLQPAGKIHASVGDGIQAPEDPPKPHREPNKGGSVISGNK